MAGARFHPKYSGSNAARILACPGQVRFAATLPDIETEAMREGTFAHAVLEACLKGGIKQAEVCVGLLSIGNRKVDSETAEAVQHALDYVETLRLEYPDLVVVSEQYMPLERYPAGGTVDIAAYSSKADKRWIIDYKHGEGDFVEANQNAQLKWYAVLCFYMPETTGVIIQPRHFSYRAPREAIFSAADLFDFRVDMLDAIMAAEQPDAPLVAGPHCLRCKCAAVCPALEASCNDVISPLTFGGDRENPPEYDFLPDREDPAFLAHTCRFADQIRGWLKSREQAAFRVACAGQHVPGFKIVQEKARRKYRPDLTPDQIVGKIVQSAGGRLEPRQLYKTKLLPITEAEPLLVAAFREGADLGKKKAAAEEARAAFAFLTLRDAAPVYSLVPETDPRPAVTNRAALDFEGVVIDHQPE
jgi:hypothetical protein